MTTSGIRLGTPAGTSRGFGAAEFEQIGRWIADIAKDPTNQDLLAETRNEVVALTSQLGYSATLCGALPVVNLGLRDFPAADFLSIRGIFNSTTNFVLAEMENGREFADALAEAQRRGIAETDPTLDVEGWDTANKLVILANTWLRLPVTVRDIEVTGLDPLLQHLAQMRLTCFAGDALCGRLKRECPVERTP